MPHSINCNLEVAYLVEGKQYIFECQIEKRFLGIELYFCFVLPQNAFQDEGSDINTCGASWMSDGKCLLGVV